MRTDPSRRGQGIASTLLLHALDDAKSRGVNRVSLETGSMGFFGGPFNSYIEDPNSTFMTLLIHG
ncbi:GCN5-related N-acetyltransferase [Mycobacteroides abscessus subsp. massiliense]|nr:GCN5-related N-acetyltransferase [Mycobacteroides abscessus subsp. massiliense]